MEKYPTIEFAQSVQSAKRFGIYWKPIPYWASEVRDFFLNRHFARVRKGVKVRQIWNYYSN